MFPARHIIEIKKSRKTVDLYPRLTKRIKIRRLWFTQSTHIFRTHSLDAACL